MLERASSVISHQLKSESSSSIGVSGGKQQQTQSSPLLIKPPSASALARPQITANKMHRKVVDLIRVDGKRFSAPETSYMSGGGSKMFPRSSSVYICF